MKIDNLVTLTLKAATEMQVAATLPTCVNRYYRGTDQCEGFKHDYYIQSLPCRICGRFMCHTCHHVYIHRCLECRATFEGDVDSDTDSEDDHLDFVWTEW
jgi:hypothetical protein